MDEAELIRKASEGDEGAIGALYQRYSARVYTIIRRLAGDDMLAEDCAQEAWVRAIRALPRFRGEARFGTWLHRIAVNSALQGRRGRQRRADREEPLPPLLSVTPKPTDALLRRRLERAMDALPDGMRRVLVLHDVEGHTHEEIAELLGIAPGTSKSQLWKARGRMRELLGPTLHVVQGESVCNT